MIFWLQSFLPASMHVSQTERLRAVVGAFLGLALTGILCTAATGGPTPWLIAPMGASAVLLFAVPASPLAQPWSILGGNIVAAMIGVTCARWIGNPLIAAPLAAALAIGAMFALRCLHPPSGAVALTTVLGGHAVLATGYHFVLNPVAVNSAVLTLAALAFNNATGRRYPHPQATPTPGVHGTADRPPTLRARLGPGDLADILAHYDQVLDISRDELEGLFQAAELRAFDRLFSDVTCAEIMSRDVITVTPDTPATAALAEMQRHDIRAMPVLDAARHVIGMVHDRDFLTSKKHDTTRVEAIMRHYPRTMRATAHVVELIPLMADAGLRQIAVIDDAQRLCGIIAQSDLVGALYRGWLMAGQVPKPAP